MSKGFINPILVRPILNKLKLVTLRMFETFAADTVVVFPRYFKHSIDLYSEDGKELFLSAHPEVDILRILKNYKKYSRISKKIRNKLVNKHSYEERLRELVKFA